jgi:hypothetical protein
MATKRIMHERQNDMASALARHPSAAYRNLAGHQLRRRLEFNRYIDDIRWLQRLDCRDNRDYERFAGRGG